MINNKTQEKHSRNLLSFIIQYRKVIFGIVIILALITPISLAKLDNITTLTNRDIRQWDTATNNSYDSVKNSSLSIINDVINRIFSFTQNMVDFISSLITFNFSVINTSGYIFSVIYLITPLVALYVIFWIITKIRNSHFKIKDIKPSYLLLAGLLFPFNTDIVWIGSLLFIFLLIYLYIYQLRQKVDENKNLTVFENISWKQTLFILAIISLLTLNTIYHFLNETFSIQKFVSMNAEDLIIVLFLLSALLFVMWLISISKVANKPIADTLKNKINDFRDKKHMLYLGVFIIFGISLLNYIIDLQNMAELIAIFINLPWIILLILFDPNDWFLTFIATMKSCFDFIVNASRIIFNTIIAPKPSDLSFFGIFQPTIWITLLIILVIMILLDILNIYYEKVAFNRSFQFKNYSRSFGLEILVFLAFLFSFVFEAKNFQMLFGDQYQIQDKGMDQFVIPFVLSIISIILFFVLLWSYFQLKKGRNWKILAKTILINFTAIFVSIIMITPFIWMLKNSLQTNTQNIQDFLQQGLLPDPITTRNYAQLFGVYHETYESIDYKIITWLFNSLVAAVLVTFFLVIFASMAGYVIAKREFVGRKTIFTLIIAILMVPPYVQVIPLYLELNRLGFVGTLLGVIFPFLIQPLSIFLAAEFMRSIPDDYLDAARVDGYSEFQIFRKIVLPLSVPVMSVLIIINLIANWNSFLWPLLLLEQSKYAIQIRTLPLGVYQVNQQLQEQMGVILALSTLVVIPMFIILFLAQDYIKKGVTVEGLKG